MHTKDDNYNDNDKGIVLKIILTLKEYQSPHLNYNDNGTEEQNYWNNSQMI